MGWPRRKRGSNAATATAAAVIAATSADSGGMGHVFLGFSGGGQANISAGVKSSMGTVAFYDPGRGLGQDLPAGSEVFTGNDTASIVVNGAQETPRERMCQVADMTFPAQ
jgi:hypothetical protein